MSHRSSGKAFEFGWHAKLLPNYLQGVPLIQLRKGAEAEVEFKRVLEHRGLNQRRSFAIFSQLGLTRAYTLQSQTTNARMSYEKLLTLWKDGPGHPHLQASESRVREAAMITSDTN